MELPRQVGLMILPSVNLFPQAVLPLFIFEPRYRRMLADSLASHRLFCVAMLKPGASRETPAPVAGLGVIRAAVENPDGTSHLILQGLSRVQLGRVARYRPYRVHSIRQLAPSRQDGTEIDALAAKVRELVGRRFQQGLPVPLQFLQKSGMSGSGVSVGQILESLEEIEDAGTLADLVSCTLLPDAGQRQIMLETVEIEARLRHLIFFLLAEIRRAQADMAD
ncbi:MAG: LON peptidase substrate-binding domain-containing protein [Limisphaerales bacterium]